MGQVKVPGGNGGPQVCTELPVGSYLPEVVRGKKILYASMAGSASFDNDYAFNLYKQKDGTWRFNAAAMSRFADVDELSGKILTGCMTYYSYSIIVYE